MFQYIRKAEHIEFAVVAAVRRAVLAVAVVDGGERDGGEVGRGARVRARGAAAVRHLHEAPHELLPRVVSAQGADKTFILGMIHARPWRARALLRTRHGRHTDLKHYIHFI